MLVEAWRVDKIATGDGMSREGKRALRVVFRRRMEEKGDRKKQLDR